MTCPQLEQKLWEVEGRGVGLFCAISTVPKRISDLYWWKERVGINELEDKETKSTRANAVFWKNILK